MDNTQKINFYKKLLLIFVIVISITIFSQKAFAWNNCPFGEINDNYPGKCGRYIDTDNDNICDLSQSSPNEMEIIQENDDDDLQNLAESIRII